MTRGFRRGWVALSLAIAPHVLVAQAPADYGPVSADVTENHLSASRVDLRVRPLRQGREMAYMDVKPTGTPNGQTVVLLHGFNFFGEAWAGTIDVLTREGFRVIVPDQIGFGRSSKPLIPYTFNDMAHNTRRLLQSLGVERAAIVGHSMGGMLASRFAMLYPDSDDARGDGEPDRPHRRAAGARPALSRRRISQPTRTARSRIGRTSRCGEITRYFVTWKPEYEKYVRIHWGWTQSPDWAWFSKVRAALTQMLSAETVVYDWQHIKSKALVIGGAKDTPQYPEQAKHVAESIPGAQLELIENVGHVPQFESPEIFHAKLVQFLKSPPP